MEKQRLKMPKLPKVNPKTAAVLTGCAVVIVLLIALCISILMRTNIQNDYTNARNEIGEELYTQIYMLCQKFNQVNVPGQDLENKLVPQMKEYYLVAQTLNDVLNNSFSSRYNVLTPEAIKAMDDAFEAYDAAFSTGRGTNDAEKVMQSGMDILRELLTTRFDDGIIKPA